MGQERTMASLLLNGGFRAWLIIGSYLLRYIRGFGGILLVNPNSNCSTTWLLIS